MPTLPARAPVPSSLSGGSNCSPSPALVRGGPGGFQGACDAPEHLGTGISAAEMARGRSGRTRGVEGAEESGSAFISSLAAFFILFSFLIWIFRRGVSVFKKLGEAMDYIKDPWCCKKRWRRVRHPRERCSLALEGIVIINSPPPQDRQMLSFKLCKLG